MARSLYNTADRVRKFFLLFLLVSLVIVVYDLYSSFSASNLNLELNSPRRFYMSSQLFEWLDGLPPEPIISDIPRDTDGVHTYVVEGAFPEFPDISYVYTIEEPSEKLLTFQNAQKTVEILGFDPSNFEENGATEVFWLKDNGVTSIFFDRVKRTWNMKTDLTNNFRFNQLQKLSNSRINNVAMNLLNKLDFDGFGFDSGLSETIFLKREISGDLIKVNDFEQAQLVLANAYRILPLADLKPTDEQPELLPGETKPSPVSGKVYTSNPYKGSATFLTKGNNPTEDVYEFSFIDWEYGDEVGAYPIVTPEEAWANIQRGMGSLVFIQRQGDNLLEQQEVLNVRKYVLEASQTEIGFYEPDVWSGFVTPIYIMRGRAELDDGRLASFIFFIDALKRL
jgi:hypothetical protein